MRSDKPFLQLPADIYAAVIHHLLPTPTRTEEAAFLFVRRDEASPNLFTWVDWFPVPPEGFVVQLPYHFELTDETRAAMIKRAHDLGASVVELHSHTGPWKPQFSPSDWSGFEELVPHMWWRLKGRPYLAIVVTHQGFDGLVWLSDPTTPMRLEGIEVDGKLIEPSRLSPLEKKGYDWTTF